MDPRPLHMPQARICSKCLELKDFDDFPPRKSGRQGKATRCNLCKQTYGATYYLKNKERTAPRYAAHRAEHREYANAYNATYRVTHAQEIAAHLVETRPERLRKHAIYHQTHQEQEQAYALLYKPIAKKRNAEKYRRDPAKYLAKNAAYKKANPEGQAVRAHRRRARKANAPQNDLSAAQWKEVLIHFNYRCQYCPQNCKACKEKTHVLTQDHITPFDDQGSHTLWNVIPACLEHNSEKHTGPPLKPVQPLLLTMAPARKPRTTKG